MFPAGNISAKNFRFFFFIYLFCSQTTFKICSFLQKMSWQCENTQTPPTSWTDGVQPGCNSQDAAWREFLPQQATMILPLTSDRKIIRVKRVRAPLRQEPPPLQRLAAAALIFILSQADITPPDPHLSSWLDRLPAGGDVGARGCLPPWLCDVILVFFHLTAVPVG